MDADAAARQVNEWDSIGELLKRRPVKFRAGTQEHCAKPNEDVPVIFESWESDGPDETGRCGL